MNRDWVVSAAFENRKVMNTFQPIFDVRDLGGDISSLAIASEPIFDIAHLAHVELLTPDLEATLCFFKNLLGLEQTEPVGSFRLPARL